MACEICGFEHLHLHTDFSLLDGYGMVEEYAQRALQINQRFLTISDHGMLGAVPRQIKACEKACEKRGKDALSPIFACLPAGHPIHTLHGAKDISEINRLDFVLTHKGRYRSVVRVMKRRHKGKMYSIALAGIGRSKKVLRLTGEHPVLLSDSEGNTRWVKAKEICVLRRKSGIRNHPSYVCLPRIPEGEDKIIPTFDYIPDTLTVMDDRIERKDKKHPYRWDRYPLWLTVCEDAAFFFGLFVAEGSFSVHKGRLTGGMRLTLNINEQFLSERASSFLSGMGIESHVYKYPETNKMELCFGCLPLAYLLKAECGAGAKNKHVPQSIMEGSTPIRRAFLDGLLAGDGKNPGDDGKGQRTLRTASKRLAYEVRLLLAAIGCWASVTDRQESGKRTYTVLVSGNVSYRRYLVTDDYILKPISSVSCDEVDEDVFNFEVEEDNSYVSEFAVHNCELYLNRLQPEVNNLEEMQVYLKGLDEDQLREARRSGYHLLAIAYNETGYKNLVRLTSWGWTKGFYKRPRVNQEQLLKHKEGLLFTSCCYNSEVGQAFDRGGEEAGFAMIEDYIQMFGRDHYFLELMLLDFNKQKPYDAFIVKAHEKYGLPLILTNDCHYCQQEDSHYQRLMLMVQTNRTIQEIQRAMKEDAMADFFELQDANLWMKSEEELNAKWEKDYKDVIPYELFCEAKRNTVKICERAKGVQLDRSLKLPALPDADDRLKEEVLKGFQRRGLPKTREYLDRIKEEYSLITRKGFSSYFLIQQMMTDEARRVCPEILGWGDGSEAVGPGRGSAVGALTCYCLGITDVDPIYEGLLFSRFMSEARGGRSIVLDFKNIDPLPPEEAFAG